MAKQKKSSATREVADTKKPLRGMSTDTSPLNQVPNTYRLALNMSVESKEGDYTSMTNSEGNEICFQLDEGEKIIGNILINALMGVGFKTAFATGGLAANVDATSAAQEVETEVDYQGAKDQAMAGNVISGVGAAASLIPGVGPIIGAGLGLVGGLVTATAEPTVKALPAQNSNPYGYATGGSLKPLSEDSVHVQADNPGQTDSVETENVKLDHNEVVTNDKVFSDSLKNPMTGNSFADDEKKNQIALGKIQKMRNKVGDKEYKDENWLKKNSEALFQIQEQLATAKGLRNQDGTPTQGKPAAQYGGQFNNSNNNSNMANKMGYTNGGPGPKVKNKAFYKMLQKKLGSDYSGFLQHHSMVDPLTGGHQVEQGKRESSMAFNPAGGDDANRAGTGTDEQKYTATNYADGVQQSGKSNFAVSGEGEVHYRDLPAFMKKRLRKGAKDVSKLRKLGVFQTTEDAGQQDLQNYNQAQTGLRYGGFLPKKKR